MRTFDAICDVFSALEEGGLQLRPEVRRHDDPEPGDGHLDAGAVVGAGAALQAVELLGEGGVVEREVVQLQSAIGQQQQLVLAQQCRVEIKQRLEGADKWVMSKFRQTTILRPFFDIFERLPKTQNFFF